MQLFLVELSTRLTSTALARWYAAFGFGQRLDALDARHASGLVRIGESMKPKRVLHRESTILATPAQLLLAYQPSRLEAPCIASGSVLQTPQALPTFRAA